MPGQPSRPWKLVLVANVKRALRASAARAQNPEHKRQFLASVRAIFTQLALDPVAKGDPLRYFNDAGLLDMQWLHDQILTAYGVDEVKKVVYVKRCEPVLVHPLASP